MSCAEFVADDAADRVVPAQPIPDPEDDYLPSLVRHSFAWRTYCGNQGTSAWYGSQAMTRLNSCRALGFSPIRA